MSERAVMQLDYAHYFAKGDDLFAWLSMFIGPNGPLACLPGAGAIARRNPQEGNVYLRLVPVDTVY